MKVSPCAGKLAEASVLVNVPRLITAYYTEEPDPSVLEQQVAFGTSGHRGSAFEKAFNDLKRIPFEKALRALTTHRHDYLRDREYLQDLGRELPGNGSSAPHPGGSPNDCQRCFGGGAGAWAGERSCVVGTSSTDGKRSQGRVA